MQRLTVEVKVIPVGSSFIAAVELGGFTIRGRRADSPVMAVRNVLWEIADQNKDEAALGLELAMDGSTISKALGELTDGNTES